MTVINTNVKSLVAQGALAANNNKLATAMERLSTGSRINSAKDDAAGLAISSRMESQIRGLNAAVRNASDGISLVQTAEGAMEEIGAMLQRMRELAVQASSDVNNSTDRANLDAEVQQLKAEIDRVVDTTRFNDKKLLDGSMKAALQIGAKAGETMEVKINNISSLGLGTISASATAGVTNASITGVSATPSVSRVTFSENGNYTFQIGLEDSLGNSYDFNINASVVDGSAKDVVDKINAALLRTTDDTGSTAVPTHLKDSINATYSGKTINIENLAGGDITIANFVAVTGGGEAAFTTVTGGTNSSNLVLNSSGATAVTSFDVSQVAVSDKNTSKAAVTVGTTAATAGDKMVLTLVANGVTTTLTTAALTATAYTGATLSELLKADTNYANSGYFISTPNSGTAAQEFVIEREDGATFTVDAAHINSSSATVATASNIDMTVGTTDVTFAAPVSSTASTAYSKEPNQIPLALSGLTNLASTNQLKFVVTANGSTEVFTAAGEATATDTSFDTILAKLRANTNAGTNYQFYKSGDDQLVVKNLNGDTFSIDVSAEVTASGVAVANVKAQVPSSLDLVAATTPYNVVSSGAPKTMFLNFSGPDTYSFKFNNMQSTPGQTSAVSVDYTGTAANLTQIAADIQAQLNTLAAGDNGAFNFSVSVDNGSIRIDELNGYKFGIDTFASTGNGTLLARAGSGQTSLTANGGKNVVSLDDTATSNTATTTSTGAVTATSVKLAFDGLGTGSVGDTYSFKISDGKTTAVVSNVIRSGDAAGDTTMRAAIQSALTVSGLDDLMTVSAGSGVGDIVLSHKLGSTVSITDFSSTGGTAVRVEPGTNNTGTPVFLDDNFNSANGSVVRGIDVLTGSRAQDAISVLDAALNDVAVERANLGAIQNRLDHTINNLTNISTNTSASRSRIQDTDYGVETANLAKAQIIQQAATAMLAQANQSAQSVLSLLQ